MRGTKVACKDTSCFSEVSKLRMQVSYNGDHYNGVFGTVRAVKTLYLGFKWAPSVVGFGKNSPLGFLGLGIPEELLVNSNCCYHIPTINSTL